ncbi:hypothetical protein GCM10009733_082010 [Nonomuraea maheshkhaliensis]|uniref:Metal-dependent hydrolase n=1 Tax=Nonomuraea maheshkhaliensis TaxID=419590 RepID=A0ABN2GKH6_9ACTN
MRSETDYATHRHHRADVGLTAGSALIAHSLLDGTAIGAAHRTDTPLTVTVAIGVIAHDFTDGFHTYKTISPHGNARHRPPPSTPWPRNRRNPDLRHLHPGRPPGHLRYPP